LTARKVRLRLHVNDVDPTATDAYLTTVNIAARTTVGGTQVVVVPGLPGASQLYYRMSVRNADQMPPICTKLVDTTALQTINDWISAL
jgi:hypothetical protein